MHQTLNNFFDATSAKNRYIHIFLVMIILFSMMLFSVSKKNVGHIDEFFSYTLANSGYVGRNHPEIFEKSIYEYIEDSIRRGFDSDMVKARDKIWNEPLLIFMFDGGKKSLSKEDVKNMMMPNDDAKFNIPMIAWNQGFDVHPPLYYFLLNTVCSVFYNNGEFSPWHGLSINLFFFFLTLPLVYRLMWIISKGNHCLSLLAMCFYALSGGGCCGRFLKNVFAIYVFYNFIYLFNFKFF